MVDDRIAPDENVSRPSSMPRDASSIVRMVRSGAISLTTRRMALAPMSSTATISPCDGERQSAPGKEAYPAPTYDVSVTD